MAYTLNDSVLATVTADFATDDHFGLDGTTNGPRKVLCSRFVLNDKSYADPSWITSLAASKVGLGSVENKSSATIRGEITSGNVTTALGFTPYDATNPSGYITSSALSPYLTSATAASTYQTALVSGTSIKTINGNSVLGSGDITITASSVTNAAVISALGFTPYNATNPNGYTANVGTVTGVTATGPVVSSGGTAPVISMAAATASVPGYLTAADWATFNGKQAALGFTPYNSSNPSGYITSSGSISGNAATATTAANVSAGADQAIVNQNNGNASAWYGRIVSKNSTSDRAAFLGTYGSIAGVFAHNNAMTAWADLYINTVDGSSGGIIRMTSSVFMAGNQALHAGNYTSYSPSLTGSGASGTWGISISGNASTAYGLNVHTARNNEANKVVRTDASGYIQAGWINTDSGDNGTTAISRVYASHDGYVRYYTPTNFRTVLDVPTRTGGSASGSWGISVTGTASNITAYTINQSLGTGNGPTFDQVYVAGWFRNVGDQGLYNSTHGHHFYATSNQYFNLAGNDGSVCGLILRTGGHQGAIRGYVYANNGNSVGFLSQDANWQIRCTNSEVELYDTTYANDFRTYITYDRNDTSYFLDPNSSSTLRTITNRGWLYINENYGHSVVGVYASERYQGVFAMGDSYKLPADGTSTGGLYGLAWSHPNAGGAASNLNDHGLLVINAGSFKAAISASIRCVTDMRAPNFTDYNDSAYYIDPNSDSNWQGLTQRGKAQTGLTGRSNWRRPAITSDTAYWGGQMGWGQENLDTVFDWGTGFWDTWGNPANQPTGTSHWTGINCQHHVSYGWQMAGGAGDPALTFIRARWGGGWTPWYKVAIYGSNTEANRTFYAQQFIDAENTGYYCDPNNTSRLNAVVADNLYAYGTVTAYYSDDRLKTRFANIVGALDKVCSLNGFFYVGNAVAQSLGYKSKMEVGLSAQEMQRVLPEVVVPAPVDETYLTIQYDRVVPLLVEAIKELRLELNQLKSLVKL
jgi:hypothetical protein